MKYDELLSVVLLSFLRLYVCVWKLEKVVYYSDAMAAMC